MVFAQETYGFNKPRHIEEGSLIQWKEDGLFQGHLQEQQWDKTM